MGVLAIEYRRGFENAWSNVATFLPKLIAAIVVVVVGVLVARLVASLVNRVLERVGFDRAVERGGIRQLLARSKYDPSDILAKLVYWALVLVTLQLAFGLFGSNPVSDLLTGLIAYLPNIAVAIVILVVAGVVARAVKDLLANLLGAVEGGQLVANAAGVAILVFGVFAALDQLKIAPRIVTALWYALLAIVVGSVVVAVGGGGIRTMQRYWERTANRVEERGPEVRDQVRAAAAPTVRREPAYRDPDYRDPARRDPAAGTPPGERRGPAPPRRQRTVPPDRPGAVPADRPVDPGDPTRPLA
jgi:hypothetical protein